MPLTSQQNCPSAGKIHCDNKNERHLCPEQGVRAREMPRREEEHIQQQHHEAHCSGLQLKGRQHCTEEAGIYINTYQFSLRICRLSSAGTEQLYVSSDYLLAPLRSLPQLQPSPAPVAGYSDQSVRPG